MSGPRDGVVENQEVCRVYLGGIPEFSLHVYGS